MPPEVTIYNHIIIQISDIFAMPPGVTIYNHIIIQISEIFAMPPGVGGHNKNLRYLNDDVIIDCNPPGSWQKSQIFE
jgi:hypothetical protein